MPSRYIYNLCYTVEHSNDSIFDEIESVKDLVDHKWIKEFNLTKNKINNLIKKQDNNEQLDPLLNHHPETKNIVSLLISRRPIDNDIRKELKKKSNRKTYLKMKKQREDDLKLEKFKIKNIL